MSKTADKVEMLAEDLFAFDEVLDEVKTMVMAQERDLKGVIDHVQRLDSRLCGVQHVVGTPPPPAFKIWTMYLAGHTGWRCAANHPGYFEYTHGAKVIFGCTTCGVSFEMADHQLKSMRDAHRVRLDFPVKQF